MGGAESIGADVQRSPFRRESGRACLAKCEVSYSVSIAQTAISNN